MDNLNYNTNKNNQNKFQDLSELSISLRKKKIKQILNESRLPNDTNLSKTEEENKNVSKLCTYSRNLLDEKIKENIINILDKIYFFLINIKIPLRPNFIKLSGILSNLYQKLSLFERDELFLNKIFDVFEVIIKFIPPDDSEGYSSNSSNLFNENHFQLLYKLIEIYQNNEKILKKILILLSKLILISHYIKEYLMVKPGFYLIQSLLSLDQKYPEYIIQILYSFCNYPILNEQKVKDFEIMLIKECDKIITYFYKRKELCPKILIDNLKLFQKIYACLAYLSISELKEIKDIFLLTNLDEDISLYEKLIFFEQYNREHLAVYLLTIILNFFCYPEMEYLQIVIENKSYQYAMDRILDEISNEYIIKEASLALANFVNTKEFRKIFIDKKYINDIINKLRKNNSYEITNSLLILISNIFCSTDENEIYSFIDSDIVLCCIELLSKIKEPILLIRILNIIELLLMKGNPNNCYGDNYKESEDKITNPFKYLFDTYGLYDILSNILLNSKNEMVSNIIKNILDYYYYDDNKINFD